MTITLTPRTEARLRERAERAGQTVDTVADALLESILDWETQDLAETVEGLRRGFAASDAGRVRPLAQFADEMRTKYALPNHLTDNEIGMEVITSK